ncbi:metallophosphoesterase [Deinococcus sp. QL22]|uniref:metallophosphoesterase n=1 Tax=Deinococcus sp. QL22 TaxID=2939437 RepID=UPI002017C8DE|nr:metallophosphoesterase [Deinococcus sp. QL22]UQN07021.1 metallophosphoesterase [Deinococcus sp. QL22]
MVLSQRWNERDWDGSWLVIPDLHGHAARLNVALKLAQHFQASKLVFLGDLIDDSPRRRVARRMPPSPGTGDNSRLVPETVRVLVELGRAELILGNHEAMAAASVLDDHRPLMNLWWKVGGREAAASYGWDGRGDSPALMADLRWVRENACLWLEIGPPGATILLSHATRPTPERYVSGLNRAGDLLPSDSDDDVVWFPLGLEAANGARLLSLPTLPPRFVASLHGHMETPGLWTLLDTENNPAYQLDMNPARQKLALMLVSAEGQMKPHLTPVK